MASESICGYRVIVSHPLIAFRQQGVAHLLANYLKSENIACSVSPTDAGDEYVILLNDESQASPITLSTNKPHGNMGTRLTCFLKRLALILKRSS